MQPPQPQNWQRHFNAPPIYHASEPRVTRVACWPHIQKWLLHNCPQKLIERTNERSYHSKARLDSVLLISLCGRGGRRVTIMNMILPLHCNECDRLAHTVCFSVRWSRYIGNRKNSFPRWNSVGLCHNLTNAATSCRWCGYAISAWLAGATSLGTLQDFPLKHCRRSKTLIQMPVSEFAIGLCKNIQLQSNTDGRVHKALQGRLLTYEIFEISPWTLS